VRSFKQISVDQSGEGRRRFELRAYLDELLLSLRPQHKRLPHTVELDCPRGIELDSYPGAWAQIVTNLVMNSLRHGLSAERPGHIRILVSESGDDVELRVKDDGVGIPADRLPRIFDAFYTTSAGTGGSGLGLAVVRDLAEQRLKGRVSVASRAGEGAEFLIRAPKFTPEAAPGPSVA
jgi:signal transduction histidine kinase